MKILIQPPPEGGSKSLNDHILKSLAAFSSANSGLVNTADVRLRKDKLFVAENKICEIYLGMEQKNIFSIQKARTYEEAVRKSLEKLRKQIGNM